MAALVLLDTAILAVPSYAETEEAAEAIIFRLKHWAEIASIYGSKRIVRSSTAEIILGERGFFPIIDNVSELLEVVGLKGVYDASDVWRSYNTILNRAGFIDDELGFEVHEGSNFSTAPPLLDGCSPADLKTCSEAVLLTASTAYVLGISNTFVATALSEAPTTLSVTGSVVTATGKRSSEVISLPVHNGTQVHLLERLEDAVAFAGANAIWANANTAQDAYFAIAAKALELKRANDPKITLSELPAFVVGGSFLTSLIRNDAGPNGSFGGVVLDVCARALLGQPKEELKAFDKPDRTRDSSKPLRTHVTKSGVALRLMIWSRPDGLLEFANVGPKWEEEIEDGDAKLEFGLKSFA